MHEIGKSCEALSAGGSGAWQGTFRNRWANASNFEAQELAGCLLPAGGRRLLGPPAKARPAAPPEGEGLIGAAPRTRALLAEIRRLAAAASPVLLRGEEGTGRELVARAIHHLGSRSAGWFVPVDCEALPAELLEGELFGRAAGGLVGGRSGSKGRFELARGGTVFLRGVAALPPPVQERLLRVLEEGVLEKVGSKEPVRADARVICATSTDLRREAAAGRFCGALAARLGEVELTLPPLRTRPGELALLVERILGEETAGVRKSRVDAGREGP